MKNHCQHKMERLVIHIIKGHGPYKQIQILKCPDCGKIKFLAYDKDDKKIENKFWMTEEEFTFLNYLVNEVPIVRIVKRKDDPGKLFEWEINQK